MAEAQHGASSVSYSLKLFMIVPFALIFGAIMLIGGPEAAEIFQDTQTRKLKPSGWLLALVCFALAGAGYWWFDAQMTALGYD